MNKRTCLMPYLDKFPKSLIVLRFKGILDLNHIDFTSRDDNANHGGIIRAHSLHGPVQYFSKEGGLILDGPHYAQE